MLHETADLERERGRLSARPAADPEGTPVLAFLDVAVPGGDRDGYARRVREPLRAALDLALTQPFTGEELPVAGLPDWFVRAAAWRPSDAPAFALTGRENYARHRGTSGAWDLQDWLYRFDPESETRGWAWWDLTVTGPNDLRIWVDTWGEASFSHLDLLWAAYLSGAASVSPPRLADATAWSAEATG
ncbi:hypothetical protein [Streptomyces sp. SBT349]|uniref:hypothetical protein n=1 Tax=Streptomyces sp. SBT349 TaxID=1580539 RepID=UPI00066BF29F|nr:hypothetical protein [Streptomyces sp. SBT349]